MSSGQGDYFSDSGGASGTDSLVVEFDWDDGFATNLLQDDSFLRQEEWMLVSIVTIMMMTARK